VNGLAQAAVPANVGPALDNKRVAAAAIDLLVVFFVGAVLSMLAGGFTRGAALVTTAWAIYYYFACELLTGQTLGKKAMGLRVANEDGGPPEMRQIAVRSVLRLIDGVGLYLVGLVTMLASGERRQRLGDMAAKTIVTTADGESSVDSTSDADVVPFNPAEPEPIPVPPGPPSPPPPPVPAAKKNEPPPFEPYRVPDEPAAPVVKEPALAPPAPPIQATPQPPEPYSPAEEPHIELVPDPPAEGEQARIQIVSPMDVVMGDDEPDEQDEPPPAPQSA
jgi:uncharacterized RDD family membrane protein YckC